MNITGDIAGKITSIAELEALFRSPGEGAVRKQRSSIDGGMAAFIDRSPFVVLATADGSGSVDASPRGGPPGFVRRLDDRHIAIPDLNGNNRLDSYRNIVAHPWAGVLLIVPGKDETLRISGPAALTTDPGLLEAFAEPGADGAALRLPKLALVVETAEIYGHCAKAFRRGSVWDPAAWAAIADAPDLAEMYAGIWRFEAAEYRERLEASYADDLERDRRAL